MKDNKTTKRTCRLHASPSSAILPATNAICQVPMPSGDWLQTSDVWHNLWKKCYFLDSQDAIPCIKEVVFIHRKYVMYVCLPHLGCLSLFLCQCLLALTRGSTDSLEDAIDVAVSPGRDQVAKRVRVTARPWSFSISQFLCEIRCKTNYSALPTVHLVVFNYISEWMSIIFF